MPELYPNMGNVDEGDMLQKIRSAELEPGFGEEGSVGQWLGVKKWLAGELKELTQLWQVGVKGRKMAHAVRLYSWNDPRITAEKVGVKGAKDGPILKQNCQSTRITVH